jgi:predicted phage terminase large subunit-like protein
MQHTFIANSYMPHQPTVKQLQFLLAPFSEALYGGAAGGGKSEALLMGALQYVPYGRYTAILLRHSLADLRRPGALIDRSHAWLQHTDAIWDDQTSTWSFPSGARLTFGYLHSARDVYRYQSAEYHYIGIDELTQLTEFQYTYMFSRLRRLDTERWIPLRMRAASNPGGEGHFWVKRRFVDSGDPSRLFVPATLDDNPFLDQTTYEASLDRLDPIARRQLRYGDWDATYEDRLFQREWFRILPEAPADLQRKVRYWDLAATLPSRDNPDPDYSVGLLLGEREGIFYVLDVQRLRGRPRRVEERIQQTAQVDTRAVRIFIEEEPGSSGKTVIDHYRRDILSGFDCRGHKVTGDKVTRARIVSSAAEAGNIRLIQAPWNKAFLDEIEAFPLDVHDDQVDALSGAFSMIPKGRIGGYSIGFAKRPDRRSRRSRRW